MFLLKECPKCGGDLVLERGEPPQCLQCGAYYYERVALPVNNHEDLKELGVTRFGMARSMAAHTIATGQVVGEGLLRQVSAR